MKKTGMMLLAFGLFALTGCEEETKSYAWYSEHPDETYDTYKKCKESGSDSENCRNARRAAVSFSHSYNSPEISDKFNKLIK